MGPISKAGDRAAARRAVADGLPALLERLWRFAWTLCRSAEEADDLVQATCLRALEKAHQFSPGTRLDSWAFSICRSIWLNDLRARGIRRGNGQVPAEEADIPASGPDAETNIFAGEVVEHVMALPQAQREAVFLVYVEGFSYREASAIMGVAIGTVMSRLAAARARLAPLNRPSRGGEGRAGGAGGGGRGGSGDDAKGAEAGRQ